MGVPTGLPGLTGNQLVYFEIDDDDWGEALNQNFKVIGQNIDEFKFSVEDTAREVEVAVARRFERLREGLNETVTDTYGNKCKCVVTFFKRLI